MLGERGVWAKLWMGWYEQNAHTPFFVWDPRSRKAGERRDALVQPALDVGPTMLEFFGLAPTKDMLGKSLTRTIESDAPVREAGLFGHFGSAVNVTDGRYVYLRKPVAENWPLHQYTVMPTVMRGFKSLELMRTATLSPALSFTKGVPVLKLGSPELVLKPAGSLEHELYDLKNDPGQEKPLHDAAIEGRMIELLKGLMREADAPAEQFARLGL
jgi:hypothetical protein